MANRPERDSYEECGRAGRHALARAYEAECTRKQLRALGAVIALTVLYSRLWDWIYVAQIADYAQLHIVDARAALRQLRNLGIIVYEGKRNARSRIGLPLVEKRGDFASLEQFLSSEKRGEPASLKRGDTASKRSGNASETEKYSEEDSERPEKTALATALDFVDHCYVCGQPFPHKQLRPDGRCEECFQAACPAA
jgi:hypothetical protein